MRLSVLARTNLILVLIATALSMLALSSSREEKRPPLTELQPQAIQHIQLHQHDQLLLDWVKQGDVWSDNQNQQPIDAKRLAGLLHYAVMPSIYRFNAKPDDLPGYGLEQPNYVLRLDNLEIALGIIDPISQLRYVRVGGQVHLISDGYFHYLAGTN